MILQSDAVVLDVAVSPRIFVNLAHNLSLDDVDFYIVQFVRSVSAPDAVIVMRDRLYFPLVLINSSARYKLLAIKVKNGLMDGVSWVDGYVYNAEQVNISFTSQGGSSSEGEARSFSGRTLINKSPVSRQVVAVGIDGDSPVLLAKTISNEQGFYTLSWRGYSGQILVTALDDYGVAFESNKAIGVGDRIHPSIPNGYVYQASTSGLLGDEPIWPLESGASVISGSALLVAMPYYRPKTAGPMTV